MQMKVSAPVGLIYLIIPSHTTTGSSWLKSGRGTKWLYGNVLGVSSDFLCHFPSQGQHESLALASALGASRLGALKTFLSHAVNTPTLQHTTTVDCVLSCSLTCKTMKSKLIYYFFFLHEYIHEGNEKGFMMKHSWNITVLNYMLEREREM